MPIKHAIWKVGAQPTPLATASLANEQQLEEMIVREPGILSSEWMLIGQLTRNAIKTISVGLSHSRSSGTHRHHPHESLNRPTPRNPLFLNPPLAWDEHPTSVGRPPPRRFRYGAF